MHSLLINEGSLFAHNLKASSSALVLKKKIYTERDPQDKCAAVQPHVLVVIAIDEKGLNEDVLSCALPKVTLSPNGAWKVY